MIDLEIVYDGPASASGRLDKVLSAKVETLSRARLQALITDGHVTVNAVTVKSRSEKVKSEDHLRVTMPPVEASVMEAQDIPLDILFEDDDLLVLNKPAGLVVHPGAGVPDGTLVNALLAHCGPSLTGIGGVERPGIVHRLDKDTSGVMVVAKTQAAYEGLIVQFSDHSIERVYHALALGSPMPPLGRVNKPIGRHPSQRTRMAVLSEERGGKVAATHYKRLRAFMEDNQVRASLIECRLETGRTHQVRVHMASIGSPLVGDRLYQDRRQSALAFLNAFTRQALHAYSLGFIHPVSQEPLYFKQDIPPDIAGLVSQLETICQ